MKSMKERPTRHELQHCESEIWVVLIYAAKSFGTLFD